MGCLGFLGCMVIKLRHRLTHTHTHMHCCHILQFGMFRCQLTDSIFNNDQCQLCLGCLGNLECNMWISY